MIYLLLKKYALYLHSQLATMVHGVMVTLRFLVPSFKVRVLVDQQKSSLIEGAFFML